MHHRTDDTVVTDAFIVRRRDLNEVARRFEVAVELFADGVLPASVFVDELRDYCRDLRALPAVRKVGDR